MIRGKHNENLTAGSSAELDGVRRGSESDGVDRSLYWLNDSGIFYTINQSGVFAFNADVTLLDAIPVYFRSGFLVRAFLAGILTPYDT